MDGAKRRRADRLLRLRRDIYDALVAERGADTVTAQAILTGVPRRTLHRVLAGGPPTVSTAYRMADALSVSPTVLFEEVAA